MAFGDILSLVSRWFHILAAITAVGGSIFIRFALLPAIQELTEESRRSLHNAVRQRWSKLVAASVLFLLASGLYNLVVILAGFKSADVEPPGYYHALFGIKFLLALGVFFIASSLSGRSDKTAKFRENPRFWLNLNLTLALAIVLISGVLRATHTAPSVPSMSAISSPAAD